MSFTDKMRLSGTERFWGHDSSFTMLMNILLVIKAFEAMWVYNLQQLKATKGRTSDETNPLN